MPKHLQTTTLRSIFESSAKAVDQSFFFGDHPYLRYLRNMMMNIIQRNNDIAERPFDVTFENRIYAPIQHFLSKFVHPIVEQNPNMTEAQMVNHFNLELISVSQEVGRRVLKAISGV